MNLPNRLIILKSHPAKAKTKQYISEMIYDPVTASYLVSPGKVFSDMVDKSIVPREWTKQTSIRKKLNVHPFAIVSKHGSVAR